MSPTAKLFMHGRSQAVRLPKECRFEGKEVRVRKIGDTVMLSPVKPANKIDWDLIDSLGDATFMPNGREQPPDTEEPPAFDP